MVCLDTSVLIAILRKEDRVINRLQEEASMGTRLSTTPVNLCELYVGAYSSRNPSKELAKVNGLVDLLEILQFSLDASKKYGEKVNESPLKNTPIGDFDLMIACIAMSHGEPLATRNIEHFRKVPGLVVQEW
jgi:tRNA(fMet)-specific endonuclease VapC